MCVTICGRFCSDEGVVVGYGNRIRTKYTAKWGVQIVGIIFQTRSNTTKSGADIWKKFYMPAPLFYRFFYSSMLSLDVSVKSDLVSSVVASSESVSPELSSSVPATDSNAVNSSFTFILFTRYTLLSTTAA